MDMRCRPYDSGRRGVIHFSEMLHLIAIAEERRQTLNVKAWESVGVVDGSPWKGNTVGGSFITTIGGVDMCG